MLLGLWGGRGAGKRGWWCSILRFCLQRWREGGRERKGGIA